ncbi:pyrroline-5-carboxylate reductase [Halalkalibacillus sediminis]|uniref:Pyrroline-5-carboxylate reductase n=1 Tax=Halalkalibacillus sediminis TaxID=2018042 RepID=A0A2I0QUH6_9BACI|nr:pyrroline-5-carboxylate reductase [Halalkalibacillus sediminis]PKR77944.1 pyrroline-5-carboxylate reductase [Halalkalibacillus sediminis]
MTKKIGFIGCGKMGQAIINGMIEYGGISPDHIIATAVTDKTIEYVEDTYGVQVTHDNKKVASESDVLYLAVKPYHYPKVIDDIRKHVREETIIVTIALGVSLKDTTLMFGEKAKVIRTMPNTPSHVGEGMTVISPNDNITDSELADMKSLFQGYGQVAQVDEKMMDKIPAVSGSSPAYVYVFIEAMADGAVKQGVPRDLAYQLSSQAVLGAAKMVLESGKHPGELKDNVCTPAGSTIKAIDALEQRGFRGTVMQAMEECLKK